MTQVKFFRRIFFLFFIFSFQISHAAEKKICINFILPGDSIAKDSVEVKFVSDSLENTISTNAPDKKRIVAAILAFPIPFGILGLHRIYLGSAPYVPVIYFLTAGGGFGILPLIDFLEIVFSSDKQFKTFEHNQKIFMWN